MAVIKRTKAVGDVKKLSDKLLFKEGLKNFRFLKKGRSLIKSMKLVEFRSYIDFEEPLLYMPFQDAPLVIQADSLVIRANNETRANELIDTFISKYLE